LAKWFIKQSRPVGNFIFFDQPTQVYFPSDSAVTGALDEIANDKDREAVLCKTLWNMFNTGLIFMIIIFQ
jgi:hypothetical protein